MTEQHRSLEFIREARTFAEEVGVLVTRMLEADGLTDDIPQSEVTPQSEAAALMVAGLTTAHAGGDFQYARESVWPAIARAHSRVFDDLAVWAQTREEEENVTHA